MAETTRQGPGENAPEEEADDELSSNFWANVQRRANKLGMNLRELGQRSGYTGLYMVSSGKRKLPRAENLRAVARELGCTVLDLLEEPDPIEHPALVEFLATIGEKATDPEREWLRRFKPRTRRPTVETYYLLWKAYQSMEPEH